MTSHSSSNFMCRICNDGFVSQAFLDDHFLDLHPTKTSYHCDICNEDFISELFLQIHNTEYHSSASTSVVLESITEDKAISPEKEGNKSVSNQSGYLQKIIDNTQEKKDGDKCWCPICFKSYCMREDLRTHFRLNHAFEANSVYVCELCDIEKSSAELLCWHLEVHSINSLSVNRFSKLRTCNMKKDESDSFKKLPRGPKFGIVEPENTSDTVEKTSDKIPENTRKTACKKTEQTSTSGKLQLSQMRQRNRFHTNVKSRAQVKRKITKANSRKLSLQVSNSKTSHCNVPAIKIGENDGLNDQTTEVTTDNKNVKTNKEVVKQVKNILKRKRKGPLIRKKIDFKGKNSNKEFSTNYDDKRKITSKRNNKLETQDKTNSNLCTSSDNLNNCSKQIVHTLSKNPQENRSENALYSSKSEDLKISSKIKHQKRYVINTRKSNRKRKLIIKGESKNIVENYQERKKASIYKNMEGLGHLSHFEDKETQNEKIIPAKNVKNAQSSVENLPEESFYKNIHSSSNINSTEFEDDNSLTSSCMVEGKNNETSNKSLDELPEEIPCDKCSLKFYNQDDLFDHIASHYGI